MTTEWTASPSLVGEAPLMLTVSDVKQYPYCPRIVYYSYLLPVRARPTTYKMEEGRREHERIAELEERRSLRAYGLAEGQRHFDVAVSSDRLGLRGRLDMVVEALGEVIPVDFKNSEGAVGLNHKYQLTAYALLVEEVWRRPVRRGFIYLIPQKRAQEVRITSNMRGWVRKALREIRAAIAQEALPEATRMRGRCVDCEFRNLCPDVW
ncbi:MAG: CRISPR-associated protein Cas4 [Chloroflexi bacterium]|nr:CRISPR-associated protein Cas4 [Chloroflexota bacterium]